MAALISDSTRHARLSNHSASARTLALLSISRHGDIFIAGQHPHFALSHRAYSSSIPSDVKPITLAKTPPIPPTPPPGLKSKPKVELRPGPAKLSALESAPSPKASTAAQTKPLAPAATQPDVDVRPKRVTPTQANEPESSKAETPKSESTASKVEIAKKDLDDAAQHGILAPPPPDAGFARRLFHQAKELFVSWSLCNEMRCCIAHLICISCRNSTLRG